MPGKFFDPARITTVAGDAVTLQNADLVTHDVRVAAARSTPARSCAPRQLDAGLGPRGRVPVHLHAARVHERHLSVVAATLSAPRRTVLAGQPLTLAGRAPAGHRDARRRAPVRTAPGRPRRPASRRAPTAATRKHAGRGGRAYRVTPPPARAPRHAEVTARIDVHVTLHGGDLEVHAMPAPKGLRAHAAALRPLALPLARARARRSWTRTAWRTSGSRAGRARTRASCCARRKGGPALVASRVVRTRNGRTAPDPDDTARRWLRRRPRAATTHALAGLPCVHGLVACMWSR